MTGLELKLHRVRLKLKVKDIAEHLGVHYTYISKLESEVQKIPQHLYVKWVEFLMADEDN